MDAPFPVSVTEFPKQIAEEEDVAETTGKAFTVTETFAVFTQPFASVPVTVYVVVVAGLFVMFVPLVFVGIQS